MHFDIIFGMRSVCVFSVVLCAAASAQTQTRPPISIGIVFDTSGSMGSKLRHSREVVTQFLTTTTSLDEFFLVRCNDRPVLASGFSVGGDEIQKDLAFVESRGRSTLLDAIYLALNEMKKAHSPRRALLVISDGADRGSLYTDREMASLIREAGVPIYSIGVYEPLTSRARTTAELNGPARLVDIAEQSHGVHFTVERAGDIFDVVSKINSDIRTRLTP